MALSPGEQALYDKAIASGQSTVSSSFVPSASLANVNAALAARSNTPPAPLTAQNYQDYAKDLQGSGMTTAQLASKIAEDTKKFEAQGYTIDPNMVSQYVNPVLQSSLNTDVGLSPTLGGGGQTLDLTQSMDSPVTGVGAGSTPGVTTGFNAPEIVNQGNMPDWLLPPEPGKTYSTVMVEYTNPQTGETVVAPSGYRIKPIIDPNEMIYRGDIDPIADLDEVYRGAFGRTIGDEGKQFWKNEIDKAVASGTPYQTALDNAKAAITSSEEATNFANTGIALSDVPGSTVLQPAFTPVQPADIQGDLDAIYRSILGPTRGIREEGLQHFTNDYNTYRQAGDTHEQALAKIRQSVTDSEEATAFTQAKETSIPYLQQYYTKYLGRQLGQEGQNYWTSEFLRLVREGTPELQALQTIESMIANSEEAKIFANTGIAAEVEDPVGEMPATIQDTMIQRAMQPALPEGGKMVGEGIIFDQATQQIDTGTGEVGDATLASAPATAGVAQATAPSAMTAQTMTAATAASQLQQTTAAVGAVSAPMMAQTMAPTDTQVAQQQAAQLDQAVRVQAPQARQLSAEELVSAPANAQVAATFAEQVQAAQAQPTPEATVQGQLANLMADFEGGETPAWAAGAMRNATAIMAQRGLGASSMAGQAIIQAAMESALPIAMQDAQTVSQFEMQNLSNRQQRAMLAAQQRAQFIGQEFDQEFQARVQNASRISDIANINFNAEQQIALENAQLAQTVDLTNLSNRQAVQMANIAQIAQLEMTNLNNRQQAAVQNAQSFLQMDLTNLSNTQQATMFDAQSRVQALLSDTSAINAARQFNASSENQADQFFANLSSQVSQFNATQSNAMEQFQIEQDSAIEQFNAQIANQRDQFNAQNQLVVAQSNAQWRRDIATLDTAALNEANKMNAESVLDISEQAYANLWQAYEDQMEYAWTTAEKELDRINDLIAIKLQADTSLKLAELKADAEASSGLGRFVGTVTSGFLAQQGVIALPGTTPVT